MPSPFARSRSDQQQKQPTLTSSSSSTTPTRKSTKSSSSSSSHTTNQTLSPLSTSPGQSAPLQPAMSRYLTETSNHREVDAQINPVRSAKSSLLNVLGGVRGGVHGGYAADGSDNGQGDGGTTSHSSSSSSGGGASGGNLSPGSLLASSSSSIASSLLLTPTGLPNTSPSRSSSSDAFPFFPFSKFDSLSIPSSADLTDDLSAILERPLYFGPNGRVLTGQNHLLHSHAVAVAAKAQAQAQGGQGQGKAMIELVGSSGSHTGVTTIGKSGLKHSEFGNDTNQNWRHTSQYDPEEREPVELEPGYWVLLTTYASYLMLIVLGHVRDFFGKRFRKAAYAHLMPSKGYAALTSDFDSLYTRRLKKRLDDCFSRPATGVAGRTIVCYDRISTDSNTTFQLTGKKTRALNISSYNYLGFAGAVGGCADAVEIGIKKYGISGGGARLEAGTLDLHHQAEKLTAQYLGMEASMIVSMGFATNSTTLPALVNKGCLIISDELNHASIRFGARLTGASVKMFKHNDMVYLEKLLREVISQGQPRTHRPWKKILVVVEGLYSMEGTLCNLPELVVLKDRYKFYLYVDEAHSVGALGPNGRGVCDYFGVDPRCVDVLMGTFTKSFGATGGYIAGNKELVGRLKLRSHAMAYAEGMSPPVLVQIIASMASIMGVSPPLMAASTSPIMSSLNLLSSTDDNGSLVGASAYLHSSPSSLPMVYGPANANLLPSWMHLPPALLNGTEGRERLRRLAFNSRYLSSGLRKLGFIVYGHRDSPIVPVLIFNPGKMPLFSRMMLDRIGRDKTPIVVVVVAYPATPLISSRVRFCLSAAHTKHDIDLILRACDEVGDVLGLKMHKSSWTVDEVIRRAEELVAEK